DRNVTGVQTCALPIFSFLLQSMGGRWSGLSKCLLSERTARSQRLTSYLRKLLITALMVGLLIRRKKEEMKEMIKRCRITYFNLSKSNQKKCRLTGAIHLQL